MSVVVPFLRPHRGYDPPLRDLVYLTGDVSIARDCGVPRSTYNDWKHGKFQDVITLDVFDRELVDLQAEVLKLRRQLKICRAIMGLLVALVRSFGLKLNDRRLPEGERKERVLKAVERARKCLRLRVALRVIGLSGARYQSWQRAQVRCELDDRPSCPRSQPMRVSAEEARTMHDMATSEKYKHLPISRLALLAQRLGKVYASAATWARISRIRIPVH
jgi:hypothetical protein